VEIILSYRLERTLKISVSLLKRIFFYGDKAKIGLFLGKSHLLCDRINDRFSWYGKRPTEYFSYF